MTAIKSRFDERIAFYLFAGAVCSFLLSLFLLQLFLGLLSLLWLFEKNSAKKSAFDKTGLILIIFFGVRTLSVFLSEYPEQSYEALYKDLLFYIGFFAMSFYAKAMDREKFATITLLFSFFAAITALTGIIRFNLSIVERAESFSSGYSTFSSYLLAGLSVTLYSRTLYKSKLNDIAWFASVSLILTGVVTSLGRLNILIAIGLLILIFILKRYDYKSGLIIVVVTVALSLISFTNNSKQADGRIGAPTHLSDRDVLFMGAKELALEHPALGFGPRTFHNIFPYKDKLADPGVGSWHNDFLQVYFESGVSGLIAFLLLIFLPLISSFKSIKRALGSIYKDIVAGGIAGIAGLTGSALTAGFINSPVLAPLFAFLLVLISRTELTHNSQND